MPNPPKTHHVIEEISYSKNTVWCICGWSGLINDLKKHQAEALPLEKEVVESAWKRLYGNNSKKKTLPQVASARK